MLPGRRIVRVGTGVDESPLSSLKFKYTRECQFVVYGCPHPSRSASTKPVEVSASPAFSFPNEHIDSPAPVC